MDYGILVSILGSPCPIYGNYPMFVCVRKREGAGEGREREREREGKGEGEGEGEGDALETGVDMETHLCSPLLWIPLIRASSPDF